MDLIWFQLISLELASAEGRPNLTIECGDLYCSVSKLPVLVPWMIFCCNAMRAEMATTDYLSLIIASRVCSRSTMYCLNFNGRMCLTNISYCFGTIFL